MKDEQMILRSVRGEQPVEVWYDLTERGHDLATVITAMNQWGRKWLQPSASLGGGDNGGQDASSKKVSIPLLFSGGSR